MDEEYSLEQAKAYIMNKFTDKEKAAKAKAIQSGAVLPQSAFEFDDENKNQ